MDTQILEKSGFTKGEIKVYLALLELGETTTGAIIRKSGITGSKVYEILEKLIEKGLASHITKERTKYFQASSPKRLMNYIDEKERELVKQKNKIEGLIPQLEKVQKSKQKVQSSQVFEGYEGMKTVFDLILSSLKSGEEYYAFSLGEELKNKNLMLFLKKYHQKRIKKGISVKIIASSTDEPLFEGLSKLKRLQIRYCASSVPLGVFVFKDYVATFTFRENPTVFLIRSEQIAESYKDFFDDLWKSIKG